MLSRIATIVIYTTYSAYALTMALHRYNNEHMEQHSAKPKRAYLIGGILAVIILIAGATAIMLATRNGHTTPSNTAATTTQQQTTITYTGIKGKTALAQLKELEQVTTKSSQYGEYVDSINGVQGGTNGKYWSFYVNSKLSDVGAGDYTATGGETITWKFE